jgi:hypothetical protein
MGGERHVLRDALAIGGQEGEQRHGVHIAGLGGVARKGGGLRRIGRAGLAAEQVALAGLGEALEMQARQQQLGLAIPGLAARRSQRAASTGLGGTPSPRM